MASKKKRPAKREGSSINPSHWLSPEDLLTFVEAKPFLASWDKCGLSDKDLAELQISIMADPRGHPVVEGTGGLRKMRFTPQGSNQGKSGSHRVCYVYFEQHSLVLFVIAYAKNQADDLSDQAKRAIKQLIERQHQLLSEGPMQ